MQVVDNKNTFKSEPALRLRPMGSSGHYAFPIVIGGHGLIGGWKDKAELSIDQAAANLRQLVDAGATHFDYTFAKERRAYREVIRAAGVEGKIKPIMWYMDQEKEEGRAETCIQDVIDNVRYHLDELDMPCAGAVIKWDNRWPNEWPKYTTEAMDALKDEGLTDTVGIGVLAGARANERYIYDTWQHWDFIAPYWNYSLRRSQMLVEFARERGMGVYSVGAFLRGAIFQWPGVQAHKAQFIRSWLKWILREPSVFGFALSMQSQDEVTEVLNALSGDSAMLWEDIQYLYDANFPIQPVDYRQFGNGESQANPIEVLSPDEIKALANGSNMISGSFMRWQP